MDGEKKEDNLEITRSKSINIEIVFEDNEMAAICKVSGPTSRPLSENMIRQKIEEEQIQFGIDENAIKEIVTQFKTHPKKFASLRVAVAKGKPVKPGRDGYLELLVPPVEKVKIHEDGTANFRDIKAFREVKKGDILGKRIPPFLGENGINVYNKVVFPLPPKEAEIQHGESVKYDGDTQEYIALNDGILEDHENWLDVNPVLTIDSNVGLETGNIDYLGEVMINGNIEREASVRTKGDVIVEGIIESGKVDSGGIILAKTGINTKRQGRVNAKLDIKSNYIEHSNVLAHKSILIGKSIVNSMIVALQDVTLLSKDSAIIGSHITAYGNVEASSIGSKTGSKTIIILGKHLLNEEHYKELQIKFLEFKKQFEKKLEQVEGLKEYAEQMKGRLNKIQIENMKKRLNEYKLANIQREKFQRRKEELKSSVFNPKPVRLVVRNTIYPGVEIRYKSTIIKIELQSRSVIYTFHPDSEKYSLTPYS